MFTRVDPVERGTRARELGIGFAPSGYLPQLPKTRCSHRGDCRIDLAVLEDCANNLPSQATAVASSVSLVGVGTFGTSSSCEPLPFSRSISCAAVGVDVRNVETDGEDDTDVDATRLKS